MVSVFLLFPLTCRFTQVTNGTHTVTESIFASPCDPIPPVIDRNNTNNSYTGFDSGPRPANTIFALEITDKLANRTLWFFDATSSVCGMGAVGAINNDESGNETIAGFTVSSLTPQQ